MASSRDYPNITPFQRQFQGTTPTWNAGIMPPAHPASGHVLPRMSSNGRAITLHDDVSGMVTTARSNGGPYIGQNLVRNKV